MTSAPRSPGRLVLLRHGQSTWNEANRFTGWADPDLIVAGVAEAVAAGHLLADAGVLPDIVHTSVQTRAIRTANLALADVLHRLLPYWYDQIVPDLISGANVLVAAHGNSLRALCKHLDDIDDEAIPPHSSSPLVSPSSTSSVAICAPSR